MLEESKSASLKNFLLHIVVLALVIASLNLAARNAADGYMYYAWAEYFASSDLAALAAYPKSITGVPFVHWSYGSGLLPAAAAFVFTYTSPLSIYAVAAFLGMASAALLVYLGHLRTSSLSISTLILAAVILFTPGGFYFNKYTSEGWTVFLVLLGLVLIEWNRHSRVRASNYHSFIFGVVIYFLLLVKLQNIIICFALWVIFAALNYSAEISRRDNLVFLLKKTMIMIAVSAIGLVFLLAYNYVVSGSFFTSPYSVGDTEYSTFSTRHLKVKEVLVSPMHGLLIYHPVVGIAFCYLLRELVLERASVMKPAFIIISICLATFLLQVFIQSAWVIWWMGIGTFGARGFSGVVILLVYALLQCKSDNKPPLTNAACNLIIILGVISSYLVTLEETSIINLEDFLNYVGHKNSISALIMITGSLVILQVLKKRWNLDRATYITYLLFALALVPVINAVIRDVFFVDQFLETTRLIQGVFLATFATLLLTHPVFRDMARLLGLLVRPAFFIFIAAIFSASIVLQTQLILDFNHEAKISTHKGKTLDCGEYTSSYNEYQRIDGYEVEKQELYDFLVRQGCYN